MEKRNEIRNEETGLVENEKGDILFGQLWFSKSKGVLELTSDVLNFINPSDEILSLFQKGLDCFQEGLFKQIYQEELEEEIIRENKKELDFIERELKDLEDMKKELGEDNEDNNEGEI